MDHGLAKDQPWLDPGLTLDSLDQALIDQDLPQIPGLALDRP